MTRLHLKQAPAIVRMIDKDVYKIIPAPYLNQPAFYVASNTTPVVGGCSEMVRGPFYPAFATLMAARKRDIAISFHPAELLYGSVRYNVTVEALERRDEAETDRLHSQVTFEGNLALSH